MSKVKTILFKTVKELPNNKISQMMLHSVPVATFPKENSMDYTVRVWLPQNQIDDFSIILNTLIVTPKGKIPLSKIAKYLFSHSLCTRATCTSWGCGYCWVGFGDTYDFDFSQRECKAQDSCWVCLIGGRRRLNYPLPLKFRDISIFFRELYPNDSYLFCLTQILLMILFLFYLL